jgi:hypothetical protein
MAQSCIYLWCRPDGLSERTDARTRNCRCSLGCLDRAANRSSRTLVFAEAFRQRYARRLSVKAVRMGYVSVRTPTQKLHFLNFLSVVPAFY